MRIMQPERAYDGHAGLRAFVHGAIEIGQQAVTEFQVFAANRLDLRIVQLAGVGNRRAAVIADFDWPRITGIPSPGQAQFPRASMAAKQRAEGAELEPAEVEFGGEFLRG